MRLDRYKNKSGKCKYALIKLRDIKLPLKETPDGYIVPKDAVEMVPDVQFFVVKATDQFARSALRGYMKSVIDAIVLTTDKEDRRSLGQYLDDLRRLEAEWASVRTKIPD